jgi:predicted  nucleic acid-binding Zn-ribbon protein
MTAPSDTPKVDALAANERHLTAAETSYWCDQYKTIARTLERQLSKANEKLQQSKEAFEACNKELLATREQLSEAGQKAIEECAAMLEDGAKLLDDTESPISAEAWRQAAGAVRALTTTTEEKK